MDDLIVFMFDLLMFAVILSIAVWFFRTSMQKNTTKQGTAAQAASTSPDQLIEDIKMVKTSSVSDAISVLDDLGTTTENYRHYCELVGKSQSSDGVLAPYSKRQVAYYDLRCYRIENRDGRDVETLVAHEKSIDPFWFSDNEGASKIYVDLDTFGNNVILVNATNRIEGPNSDFTKALSNAVQNANSGRGQGAYAMARLGVQAAHNVLAGAAQGARIFGNTLLDVLAGGNRMQPALAGVAVTTHGNRTEVVIPAHAIGENALFADKKSGLYGGFSFGGIGMGGIPTDLDDFLEGAFSGGRVIGYGGPKFRPASTGDLLGIGLGALLSTLATTGSSQATTAQPRQQDSFRGYRLIEDVVPLGSPIYALGEIYHSGTDVHIGRSISDSYPSSYFATKSEAEVLSSLK